MGCAWPDVVLGLAHSPAEAFSREFWMKHSNTDRGIDGLGDNLANQKSRDGVDHSIIRDLLRPRPRVRVRQPKITFEHAARAGDSTFLSTIANHPFLFALIPIAVAVVLWFGSEPVLLLQPDPPAEFTAVAARMRGNQQLWARHYWQCAREIQSRYTYGEALPDTPPADFRIPEEATVPKQEAADIRLIFWYELQRAWLDPNAWQATRRWRAETILHWLH